MKTKLFTLCLVALLISSVSFAKIRRVGYFGTAIVGTDYSSLQAAHDSASTKDTIMLYPGTYTATYTKNLVTLGYGYFVSGAASNANLQAITGGMTVSITLNAGSDSSRFEGIDGLTMFETYQVNIKNIILKRCNIAYVYSGGGKYANWQVIQSYVNSFYLYYAGSVYSNLLVSNCYVGSFYIDNVNGQSGIINNNVFYSTCYFGTGNFLIKNNIFVSASFANALACTFQNNVSDGNNLPAGNGNVNSVTTASLFVGYPTLGSYSNDGRLALKAGSPAIGAGEGGIDCGMFGGSTPYRLSGIPSTPSFYKLTAPSNTTSTNPYTITFSVRANN